MISLFRDSGRFYRNSDEMFALTSWVQVMLGQRIVPRAYHPLVDLVAEPDLIAARRERARRDRELRRRHARARTVHRALLQGAGGRMMRDSCASASHASSVLLASALLVLACKTPAQKPRPHPVARVRPPFR